MTPPQADEVSSINLFYSSPQGARNYTRERLKYFVRINIDDPIIFYVTKQRIADLSIKPAFIFDDDMVAVFSIFAEALGGEGRA